MVVYQREHAPVTCFYRSNGITHPDIGNLRQNFGCNIIDLYPAKISRFNPLHLNSRFSYLPEIPSRLNCNSDLIGKLAKVSPGGETHLIAIWNNDYRQVVLFAAFKFRLIGFQVTIDFVFPDLNPLNENPLCQPLIK